MIGFYTSNVYCVDWEQWMVDA